jgi:hypothetical protein
VTLAAASQRLFRHADGRLGGEVAADGSRATAARTRARRAARASSSLNTASAST